jgi:hypothetical protein
MYIVVIMGLNPNIAPHVWHFRHLKDAKELSDSYDSGSGRRKYIYEENWDGDKATLVREP